jgi:hypothetical protein
VIVKFVVAILVWYPAVCNISNKFCKFALVTAAILIVAVNAFVPQAVRIACIARINSVVSALVPVLDASLAALAENIIVSEKLGILSLLRSVSDFYPLKHVIVLFQNPRPTGCVIKLQDFIAYR